MSTHDPKQVIEELRNHLAAGDRRLTFLFGAGTSSAVNIAPAPKGGEKPKHEPLIPGVDGLTDRCETAVREMGEQQAAAWEALVRQCKKDARPSNVENLLTRVRVKVDAVGDSDTLLGLNKEELLAIERAICTTIARIANPSEESIPDHTPHNDFASWVTQITRSKPIEVFTLNYDILIERACEAAHVPVFDGFAGLHRPFFYAESLEDENLLPASKWLRLWKIHGSVNWQIAEGLHGKQTVRTRPTDSGELILPSHRKYDESRKQPYVAYMDRLARLLNLEHALLVTCGYSFGDEHINALLFGALDTRNTANVVALQHHELRHGDDLVKAALRRLNLTVIGPNAGVISGRWGDWKLTRPVDEKTYSFMDEAFDSHGLPEEKGSPSADSDDLHGTMRLGDFNRLCRFLCGMVSVPQ